METRKWKKSRPSPINGVASRLTCHRDYFYAVKLTAPVAMAYIPLGIAFGVLLVKSGITWYWAPISAFFIFAGSVEFLAIALITGGASVVQTFITAIMVQFRHLFYGLTFPISRLSSKTSKAYGVWALTDETYAITASGPGSSLSGRQITTLQLVSHFWWTSSATLGALVGSFIPPNIVGFGFALTAMFIILLVDSLRNKPSMFQFAAALASVIIGISFEFTREGLFLVSGLLFI